MPHALEALLAIAVQNRALLNVSHFGDGASDFHCQAPKGTRNQLTSQSCNGTLSAGLASTQVRKVFVDRFFLVFACLPTCRSGEHTSRGMDDAVRSGSPMPVDPLLLVVSRGPVLDFLDVHLWSRHVGGDPL